MKTNKRKIFKYNSKVTKFCCTIIFLVLFVLLVLNSQRIQFLYNDFDKLSKSDFQIYFLDVGQASATLIIFPNGKTLVVDTGSGESEGEFINQIDQILSQNKLKNIDMLLLTHSDEDHVGGAVALLRKYKLEKIFRPTILSSSPFEIPPTDMFYVDSWIYADVVSAIYNEPNCEVEFVSDTIFEEGGCTIEIFACKEKYYGKNDVNAFSPFVTFTYSTRVFMLCGDATLKRETEFIETLKNQNRKIKVDFLLVAHHGARSSSSEEFLSFINPSFAVVSAGDNLHPSQDVLDRLIDYGVNEIFCTKEVGMIGVGVFDGGDFKVKTMSRFFDLPLIFCIVFVGSGLWVRYFSTWLKKRKFTYSVK